MIRQLSVYESRSVDPYYNLAAEQHLLETVEDTCVLYLWQNRNTVVIGRNQNPWAECKTALLSEEGGYLARRLSGGGAVFHDLGNLNFTFLMPQSDFDLEKQLSVILEAVRSFGIRAEFTGRNDIVAAGRKFSGSAFYKNGKQAYHHGTLLVDLDMGKLSRYLSPTKAKLQSKGVDSVRSRVVNLKELAPDITVEALKEALKAAFARVYALPLLPLEITDTEAVNALAERNRSWEWNFGHKMPFSMECRGRFPWGSIQLLLQAEHGMIRQAKVYTDAMDAGLAPRLEQALAGCRLERAAVLQRLELSGVKEREEICGLLLPNGA